MPNQPQNTFHITQVQNTLLAPEAFPKQNMRSFLTHAWPATITTRHYKTGTMGGVAHEGTDLH